MTTHPTTRRQGTVDVLGTISSLLAGYSGGITIIRELAQNTDDVPGEDDRWLELHFEPDRLVIRNNTVFRPVDFDNIMRIARGGKQQEQRRTIGAFGVGFVSVYQLTDTPIVRSADRELTLMPGLDEFPIDEAICDPIDHTVFTLPYRQTPTPVGQRLRMPHVTDTWIAEILRDLPGEIYRLLFFLRRLSRITVFHAGKLLSEVSRVMKTDPAGFEEITLTVRRGDAAAQIHTWLRFRAQVPGNAPTRADGQPAKDRDVHVVVPDRDVPDAWLSDQLAGRLYNYLPTEIATGLPFQINGDFFPSTDRKAIDNDHPNSKAWNQRVIAAIGACVASALPRLLARFADVPLQLYRRIDLHAASDLMDPISAALVNAARTLKIFKTSDGWRDRLDTRWIDDALRPIAQEMSPALMDADLQEAAWTLLTRLDVREFTFADVLSTIRHAVKPGTSLADGPAYLRTVAQVEALYVALDSGLAQGIEQMVKQTPIFLDHTRRLRPADACVRSPQDELRKDLAESGLAFWNFHPEQYRLAASLVAPFRLDHLWDALRRQFSAEVALAEAPEWINSPTKLYRLYRTIIRTREPVLKSAVAGIPLCLNREARLCRADRLRMPERDRVIFEILADDPDAPLVAQPAYDDKSFRELYRDMGVQTFQVDDMFDRLAKLAREEVRLEEAHPCLLSREKLLRLYRYLRDNRDELEPKHTEALRHRLPIWLCRDGMLRRAKDRALPPEITTLPGFIRVDHVLDLDGSEQLRIFLAEVVQLRPLGIEPFITQALIPQFPALDRKEQIAALRFLREVIATIGERNDLREALKKVPLIYGADDLLHRPIDLCFPRAECQELFPDRFSEPHQYYDPPTSADLSRWIWYDLFRLLGVNHLAPATVIQDEIKRIITRPPRQGRERIEVIFRYLEKHWDHYQSSPLSRTLRDERWLPADGDDVHWYAPKDLYQRQEKPLVSQVARVLGFREARRPRANIADALGFPASVPVSLMVKQLLALSDRGEPVEAYLYQTLSRLTVSGEELKPLRGRAVIYANDRYWKPEQIFLSNQQAQFGPYRGYLTSGELYALFQRLGARIEPITQDYVDLLREISRAYRDNLPAQEVQLVSNAYKRLAAEAATLPADLRAIPCVLSASAEDGPDRFMLRLPECVILTPPEEYRQLIPDLPIALYETAGEPTLRALGVRVLDQVLRIEHLLQPSLAHPVDLTRYFGPLARAIRRLFFHHGRSLDHDLPRVEQRLCDLRGYWQEGIQVVYHVQLGPQTYRSQPTRRHVFSEGSQVYLDRRLTDATLPRELARVLGEVIDLRDGYHSLLKELIADPQRAMQILDDNNIKPLPLALDLAPVPEQAIVEITVGVHSDSVDPTDSLPPPPVERSEAADSELFPDAADERAPAEAPRPKRDDSSTREGTPPLKSGSLPGRNGSPPRVAGGASPLGGSGIRPITPSNSGVPKPSRNGVGDPAPVSSRPKPQPDPAAPAFTGTTTSSSPAISTDYDGLRDRARRWAEETGQPLSDADTGMSPQARPARSPRVEPSEQRNVARLVLSFPEVRDGFLRLTTAHARALFAGSPTRVACRTDSGTSFPLWLDWHREVPIAYNQDMLGAFFATESLPAGGVVYLQREHDETFRLYYHQMPHVVPEVRIAFHEQGEIRYEIHDVEVLCETDDAIYRAERRFEDQAALWLEAVDKKSVEETICGLLMSTPDGWLHEDEITAAVAAIRMVAASTVTQTLRAKHYFEHDGQGYWRLNPARLLAHVRDDTVTRWQKATFRLLRSDDQILEAALPDLRPPLNELTGRLLQIEALRTPVQGGDADILVRIRQLNDDPDNQLLGASVDRTIQQRVQANDVDLVLDTQLRAVFGAATTEVWAGRLRGTLRKLYLQLRQAHHYQRAYDLVRSWSDFDAHHGLDLAELASESQAARLISGNPPALEVVLEAIAIAPTLALAREKLHLASQAALCRHEPGVFLAQGNDERAVDAFFAHITAVAAARPKLERAAIPAFDRTVIAEARQLWPQLSDSGRLRLLLWMPRYIEPSTLSATHDELALLVRMAERHQTDQTGLLIGLVAWRLCPEEHPLQQRIANHLARCHCALEIWEKANNRPWKQHVEPSLHRELQAGWQRHNATIATRERRILERLRTEDPSPLGVTLEAERADLYQRYAHEYQRLLESAA